MSLPLDDLASSPFNFFTPGGESLEELAESIREVGVLHPLLVRPLENGKYEIVSGHRRCMASEIAGLTEVPCVVKEMDDTEAELALIDANLETRQLSPMEMARAIRRKKELLDIRQGARTDLTSVGMSEVARQFGVTERHLRRLDKLNDLIPELQSLVDAGRLGISAGERLAALPEEIQQALYEALGDDVSALTSDEVKRLREENDRGYMVLEVYQEKIRELEDRLHEYEERDVAVEDLEGQLRKLKAKKRELEYDVMDRENAVKAVEQRAAKKGVALLQLMQQLARPVQAARPDIDFLVSQPLDPGVATQVIRWATVLKEVGEQVEAAARQSDNILSFPAKKAQQK